MDSNTKILISKLKELDPLALIAYEYYLKADGLDCILFNLDELFEIINNNIQKFFDKNSLNKFLTILHYTIKYCKITDEIVQESVIFFNNIYQKYQREEDIQILIFEFLHQMLVSIKTLDHVFIKLVPKFDIINVYSDSKAIRLRSRFCLELLINIFPNIDILTDIISYDHIYFAELFTHFIPILLKKKKLYKNEIFWYTCARNLLTDNRKFAIYWLKLTIQEIEMFELDSFEVSNFFKWSPNISSEITNSWNLLLTILESLDGKQSHLILPSLEYLKINSVYGIWNKFVICEIMKHTNTLVLKWGANFILERFTCNDFDELDKSLKSTQKSLNVIIQGFNNTFLYIGTNCLKPIHFKNFISKNPEKFFVTFVNINWKSIPLYILMQSLDDDVLKKFQTKPSYEPYNNTYLKMIETEDLFKLAGKIRRVENKIIRVNIRKQFFKNFEILIDHLEFKNYFKMLELLFNVYEEKMDYEIKLIENRIRKIKGKTNIFSFGLLKTLLKLENKFDGNVNRKIYNYILLNSSLDNKLRALPLINFTFAENFIKNLECHIQTLNVNEDINFLLLYLKLFSPHTTDYTTVNYALEIVIKDFKNIGTSQLKSDINFSILKQEFVDQVATKIFDLYDIKFSTVKTTESMDIDALIKDLEYFQNVTTDLYIEMFLNKGSFKTLRELLKKQNLTIKLLSSDFETKLKYFNINLFERILSEILINSKKFGFKYVMSSVQRLVYIIGTNFPDKLNCVLDIDTTNSEYFGIVFLTLLENKSNLNSNLKDFYSSECGLNFLIQGLLYGEPLLGEPRMEYEILIENKLTNSMVSPSKVRALVVELVHSLICDYFSNETILKLRDKLLTEGENLNNKKARYFKNSKQHRIKLRISQALLLLYFSTNLPNEMKWSDRFLKSIFEENNQTDVTYIMELLIAKTIPNSRLLELLQNSFSLNNCGIISLFVISFIMCYNHFDQKGIEFIKKIIKLMLPWTMGQNFHIRLYAQISVYHLIKHFKLENDYILFESILENLKQGTIEKNYKKLNHDFRFKSPDFEQLLQIHIIYYAIPRLNHTDIDEWYIEDLHEKYSGLFKEFYEEIAIQPQEQLITNIENVQRKVNPIFSYENEAQFCSFLENTEESNKMKDIDMIIIASLIDKLPNLGGIARTCEVLGIKNLAISSLKYTETKEFKGLSMTAEKWLKFFELKSSDIQNYLLQMKANGYEVIGAEQTANSQNFISFKFPKKSILLLGHEKEGIPANLIAFLDYAVEVPQFGMVRSLNVHVTGALFMWEFCKQYIASK